MRKHATCKRLARGPHRRALGTVKIRRTNQADSQTMGQVELHRNASLDLEHSFPSLIYVNDHFLTNDTIYIFMSGQNASGENSAIV